MLRIHFAHLGLICSMLALVACNASSPDQLIAYQMDQQIWVMNPDGTQQHQLMKLDIGAGGPRWSSDGNRIAFTGIWPDGSTAIWIADSKGMNRYQASPTFDSIDAVWLNQDMLLTTVVTDTGQTWNNPQAHYVLDLRDGTMREYSLGPESVVPLPQGDRWLAWNPTSWGLTLYDLSNQPQQIFPEYGLSGPTAFDISPSGDEVVFQGRKPTSTDPRPPDRIYRAKVKSDNQLEPQEILALECCAEINWSPDGKWIAVLDQTNQFHIIDASTNSVKTIFRPGFLAKSGGTFQWSPDSQWLLVESMNYGTPGSNNILEVVKINPQTGIVTRLTNNDKTEFSPDWGVVP